MAILGRILRFVLWLLLATWLARKVLDWLLGKPQPPEPLNAPSGSTGSLQRDPICGTYVAPEISRILEHAGQLHHFCSAECRARFITAHRLQISPDRVGASA